MFPGPLRGAIRLFGVSLILAFAATSARAASADVRPNASLPDPAVLLHEVEARQIALDRAREDYTFRAVQTVRQLDASGNTKKVETQESEVFFVNGHRIEKLVRKNGMDLSPSDAKKEQDRVNKEAQKYARGGERGADPEGITVNRLLQIVSFSNPRRVNLGGRETIAVDFAGDPRAKTHGLGEEALKKVTGTVWIDERDLEVSRMNATLDENYHVGFGILASVAKGSNVIFDQALVRNEAWLPTGVQIHLRAKSFFILGVRDDVDVRYDHYRKFRTGAEQQPGATVVSK